ncbi:hypothetical protein MKZ38_004472 [Zalerion maritima]|uniref:DUF6594 domain-containing protein n=1 Tax=Zalerion maritima TaxID=339359 RepID=A0AAD5RLK3_9PEZI|nr:hypothetical protein MKZ38_004472 [Zalerion maritima]
MSQPDDINPTSGDDGPDPSVLMIPAALMSGEEDWTIFRRFDDINILNLLILQEEVQQISKGFKALCSQRKKKPDSNPAWYMPAYPLSDRTPSANQEQTEEEIDAERRVAWGKLKQKTKEYNTALLEMAQLRSLKPPHPTHVKNLRRELERMGKRSLIPDESKECWDSANDDDFVALRNGVGPGGQLYTWIKLGIQILKWELWGRRKDETSRATDDNRVIVMGKKGPHVSRTEKARRHAFVSRFAMALFGGIALIVPTVIMAKVEGINVSLVTTSVAVLLFGVVLAFGATDSTGKDVLAATAAYTAVLVVFIGTSLAGGTAPVAAEGTGNTASA